MKICLYAHNWHYLDMYEPLFAPLKKRNISWDLLILRERSDAYAAKYGGRYENLIEPFANARVRLCRRIVSVVPFAGYFLNAVCLYVFMRRFFSANRYSVLAVSDDRALYYPLVTLLAAKRAGVRCVLYPVETVMFADSLVADKAVLKPFPGAARKFARFVIEKFYPQGTALRGGEKVHFYLPRYLLPFIFWNRLSGVLPRNPWTRGSNPNLDAVAVNSRLQFEENVRQGIPKEKMVLTGFPPNDKMAGLIKKREELKTEIAQKLGFDGSKKIFLIMGTHLTGEYQAQEIPAVNRETGGAFKAITEALGDYSVVCKVHPKISLDEQASLLDEKTKSRVIFTRDEFSAAELIAASDAVFMFVSSTINASLASDGVVFAYKLKNFPSFDEFYNGYGSISRIEGVESLKRELESFRKNPVLSADFRLQREKDRKNYGLFDGGSAERFADFIGSVAASAGSR